MVDAIIILGSGINADGSLPDIPKLRVLEGVNMFKHELSDKIIVSGNYSFWLDMKKEAPIRSEASAMKEYALSLGIPEMNILAEEKSKDTLGNAFFTKITYLEKYNWKNVIVITSDFHLNRTKFLFDNVLGPQYAIKYISVPSSLGADERKKN